METVSCKALKAFTLFVEGHGQVHGDPDNKDKAAKNPAVPVHVVDRLVAEGCVEAPAKSKKGKGAEPAADDDEAPAE